MKRDLRVQNKNQRNIAIIHTFTRPLILITVILKNIIISHVTLIIHTTSGTRTTTESELGATAQMAKVALRVQPKYLVVHQVGFDWRPSIARSRRQCLEHLSVLEITKKFLNKDIIHIIVKASLINTNIHKINNIHMVNSASTMCLMATLEKFLARRMRKRHSTTKQLTLS